MESVVLTVSEFVDFCNQSLELAFPAIRVKGEVSEFRISKSKWLYFKLKDEHSSVQFFGSVYQMQHPIEDGMLLEVMGIPRLHNKYGFSINVRSMKPSGEGTIKKAFELLKAKLDKEGLFDPSRKRLLPGIPKRIGLITSEQAAAYGDFMRILQDRWQNVEVLFANVQVQGDPAPRQIIAALEYFNQLAEPVDVIVITRGGGSAEDLQVFSTEQVARAIAGSRTPTLVGVGHEVDVSLADLVADVRAATPTNAAQIVVPDRREILEQLHVSEMRLNNHIDRNVRDLQKNIEQSISILLRESSRPQQRLSELHDQLLYSFERRRERIGLLVQQSSRSLTLMDPDRMLRRGYSLVTGPNGNVITKANQVAAADTLMIKLHKGIIETEVTNAKS